MSLASNVLASLLEITVKFATTVALLSCFLIVLISQASARTNAKVLEYDASLGVRGGDSCLLRANGNCQSDIIFSNCGNYFNNPGTCLSDGGFCYTCSSDLSTADCPSSGALYETCTVSNDADGCGVERTSGCEYDVFTGYCGCTTEDAVDTTNDCERKTISDSEACPF